MTRTTLQTMREHLGASATEADLEQFRAWVRELMERDGLSTEDAVGTLWADGDYVGKAAALDLSAPTDAMFAPCAGCGRMGYVVDTTAGECIKDGLVVATAPTGATLLLAGREDGSGMDGAFCEACGRAPRE